MLVTCAKCSLPHEEQNRPIQPSSRMPKADTSVCPECGEELFFRPDLRAPRRVYFIMEEGAVRERKSTATRPALRVVRGALAG